MSNRIFGDLARNIVQYVKFMDIRVNDFELDVYLMAGSLEG